MWKNWSAFWQRSYPGQYSEWPVHLYDQVVLDYWLSKVVVKVRNSCVNMYPPNALYPACCGLQR